MLKGRLCSWKGKNNTSKLFNNMSKYILIIYLLLIIKYNSAWHFDFQAHYLTMHFIILGLVFSFMSSPPAPVKGNKHTTGANDEALLEHTELSLLLKRT